MNKFYEQLDYYADDLRRDKEDKKDILIIDIWEEKFERRGKEIVRMSNQITSNLCVRVW